MVDENTTSPEPLTKKELEELCSGVMKHPALALYEWPEVPEISKQENPVAAWLAEATAYIALHLQAHNCFRLEISNENLKSLKLICPTLIDIQNHLPSVLPNYESRYNQVYKPFQEILQNFDAIADTPAKRAGIFLERVRDFLNLILTMHSETLRQYGKAEQGASSKAGETKNQRPAETGGKVEGNKIMRTSKENWEAIRGEYDISKVDFARKIKFVKDRFKKNVIFRDVEHAFVLASEGYSKPALILAGGVIEELLRQYLKHRNIKPKDETFFAYIKACENNDLLKRGVSRLSDSIRDFRNLVHLDNEKTKRHTVSKATAKGAVSSIFTIANDFQ